MADINLSDIAGGTGGFVINGQCAFDYSGRNVSAAGDVNGDGWADLIAGAFTRQYKARSPLAALISPTVPSMSAANRFPSISCPATSPQ